MDIYSKKSRWKIYLAIAGIIIMIISMLYTKYLADSLKAVERNQAELWVKAFESMAKNEDLDADMSFQTEIITSNNDIPILAIPWRYPNKVELTKNFDRELEGNEAYFEKQLAEIKKSGPEPIELPGSYYIYYKQSRILTLLTYFPFVQILLISSFILVGYWGFSAARRGEQNRVWAGLAKETAHQLGTPITAIVAWIEHLKIMRPKDKEVQEILVELDNDVNRLNLVADRFSKIGAAPVLEPINVYEELEKCRVYMERRSPRKVVYSFPTIDKSPIMININSHLFDWVIENLLRNALDAMDGKGQISATVQESGDEVIIDISDTGKGIPNKKLRTVFQPGFTTKKRGWGLGLSLAKRIVEEYHSGKIFVKKSVINEGTTFTIKLPKG